MKKKLRIALAQINCRLGDIEANLDKHLDFIDAAVRARADVVMFPELSLTGYSLKDAVFDVALTVQDRKLKALYSASRKISIAFGMVELTDQLEAKNTLLFLERGTIAFRHRKVYLPTYGVFEEKRYFTAGNRFRSFDSRLGRFGLLICEDMWHPTSTLVLALDGALVMFVAAAGVLRGTQPEGKSENIEIWENLNRTSAHIFTSYFVFCNRVGFEDGLLFWGGSEVIDPHGKVVAKAPYFKEHLLVTEIDGLKLKHARIHTTLLSDERIDLVAEELRRIASVSKEY